jgi:hypothetical protein
MPYLTLLLLYFNLSCASEINEVFTPEMEFEDAVKYYINKVLVIEEAPFIRVCACFDEFAFYYQAGFIDPVDDFIPTNTLDIRITNT